MEIKRTRTTKLKNILLDTVKLKIKRTIINATT